MTYTAIWSNPQQAHASLKAKVWPEAKALMTAGKRLLVTVKEVEDERTIKQHRFYRGPVLGDIAAQASIEGQKWSQDAWHELFKRTFLPRQVTKCKVAGKKRPVVSVKIASTTGLSIKKMSTYLDKVIAFATNDLGVQFTERQWEHWNGYDVDMQTGELR
jgi:hypothetical protein